MNKILIILGMFCFVSVCKAEQPKDTIDNWQVYLGKELLFAGNATMKSLPEILIDKTKIDSDNKLRIVYNHCVPKHTRKEIQIADSLKRRITQYYFRPNQPMILKINDQIHYKAILLYFNDAEITMPAGIRGTPILKLKFL